jgi:hypothetical protein
MQAHIEQYAGFVRRESRFYVLCTVGYPEDWLVPKLMADGAQLHFLGNLPRGYKDQTLFEVVMPPSVGSQ